MTGARHPHDRDDWDRDAFFDELETYDNVEDWPIRTTAPFDKRPAKLGLMLGVCVALYCSLALLIDGQQTVSLIFIFPFCLGIVIGRMDDAHGPPSTILTVLMNLFFYLSVFVTLILIGLIGPLCGLIMAACGFVPFAMGVPIGIRLRPPPPDRWSGPFLWLFVGTFLACEVETAMLPPPQTMSQTTSILLEATPAEVFDALIFYEDCDHDAPFWFSIGFPRPLGPATPAKEVGVEQLCLFTKGWVKKRIDVWEFGEALEFEVLDHEIGFERSVRLLRGGYRLERVHGGTRLSATTVYQANLTNRFLWAPIERVLCRDFHEYLLEGVEKSLQERVSETPLFSRTEGRIR